MSSVFLRFEFVNNELKEANRKEVTNLVEQGHEPRPAVQGRLVMATSCEEPTFCTEIFKDKACLRENLKKYREKFLLHGF